MSRTGETDFTVVAGDDLVRRLRFANPDGTAIDVSDWTFLGEARREVTDTDPLAVFDFDLAAAADGIVDARLAADDTAEFAGSRFVYFFIRWTTDLDPIETHTAPYGRINVIAVRP